METLEKNKAIVDWFNKEFVEEGNEQVFEEIIDPYFVFHEHLHTAAEGREAYRNFFHRLMKVPHGNIKVTLFDIVAEEYKVVVQKMYTIYMIQANEMETDELYTIEINAVEIIHLKDGKYIECWNLIDSEDVGMNVHMKEDAIF